MDAPGSRWFFCLCTFLLSFQQLESSRVRNSFYAQLKYLLNPSKSQGLAEASALSEVEIPWSSGPYRNLGQISGVAVNPAGEPVIFHRGPRIWDYHSFNETNHYLPIAEGPIAVDTVVTLDPETGSVLSSWGGGIFYLPHGIHIDSDGHFWLTDVALHQVFKFSHGSKHPLLTFGKRFKPGSGVGHLCKPTSVATSRDGHVFVADGYCNSRILKFDRYGELIRVFPQNYEHLGLAVPHSLTLLEKQGLLCIADRENARVVCVDKALDETNTQTQLKIQQGELGRIFAVASKGDLVYAVNGPTSPDLPVQGFTIDPLSRTIVDRWQPSSDVFHQPHDLAVSPDGQFLYVAELEPNRLWKFNL